MSKNTSVVLGDHFQSFIGERVRSGQYSSASEVVRDGLRLLEVREAHLESLRAALIEGEESGPAVPFDFDEFLRRKRAAHDEK